MEARKRSPIGRLIGIVLVAVFFLSGCIQYDVGINVAGQNHGEIVQHIRLDNQLTNFSDAVVKEWLKRVEQRTRQLGGRVKRPSKQELIAIIPFNNGRELSEKFNQFFNPVPQESGQSAKSDSLELPSLDSHLQLTQTNLLLLERNHLTFDLDLRQLGVLSTSGNLLISPGSLLDLKLSLKTPWGGRSAVVTNSLTPTISQDEKQLVWTLKAGETNHLEAIFWVPSPLGIGTVAIALVVAFGMVLKSILRPQAT